MIRILALALLIYVLFLIFRTVRGIMKVLRGGMVSKADDEPKNPLRNQQIEDAEYEDLE